MVLAIVVFAVAAPDGGAVLVSRVPCLPAVPSAAVVALDLGTENAGAAVRPAYGFPALDLLLNRFPFIRVNDRLMAVLDILLRHFALIDLSLLGQIICRETLLANHANLDTNAPHLASQGALWRRWGAFPEGGVHLDNHLQPNNVLHGIIYKRVHISLILVKPFHGIYRLIW